MTALAPDASSLRAAHGLSGRWLESGARDGVLWGECRGSGKGSYLACVDTSGPAYKCSCPSRKFPCKHALGLMLRWADGHLGRADMPSAVHDWVAARAARAARAAGAAPSSGAPGSGAASSGAAETGGGETGGGETGGTGTGGTGTGGTGTGGTGTGGTGTGGTADPAAARRRAEQRSERVAGGMTELRRWLDDQVEQGLAGTQRAGYAPFETMAARLVDAQAPGAAGAVRRMGAIAGIGPHWADRLLAEMALLRLLTDGHDRLDSLDPGLAATVRARIGFPVTREQVLAGPRVRDDWLVLGEVITEDGPLLARRTWLHGTATGRFALLLAFAAPGRQWETEAVPGTAVDAELCFYPGAPALRAVIADRRATAGAPPPPAAAQPFRAALAAWSAALAAEPWRRDMPVLLAGAVPTADGWLVDRHGDALPLAPGHREPWWLLAAAGGAPVTVAAEWSPEGLAPLAAWVRGRYVRATGRVPDPRPAATPPELPPELLATALVGTGRRTADTGSVRVGDRRLSLATAGGSDGVTVPPTGSAGPASLLAAAGAAVVYRRAGVSPASGRRPVSRAPDETAAPLPSPASARLVRILEGGVPGGSAATHEILAQWLALAARHGGRVPPESLPALLDTGRRQSAVRPAIARVGGRRAGWLAAMQPPWQWLLAEEPGAPAADDPAVWETGTGGERLAYLRRLRARDPAAARELIDDAWAGESAGERERLVTVLGDGLSTDDEPLLERALDDRRKEVREAALDLLRALPGSAVCHRMGERARTAVRLERRSVGRDRLVVEPPTDLDAGLRRDGVTAQPPRGAGISAWLLEEIVAGTPLEIWTDDVGRDPAGVLALARGHDWEAPLLHGWARAAVTQRAPSWAAALVAHDARRNTVGLREAVRWELHLVLPPDELAAVAADFLRRADHLANRLLAVHRGVWPEELATTVVETVAQRARADRHSWQLAELCRAAALGLPSAYAPVVQRLADQLGQESAEPSRVRPVAELAGTLTFRHEMHLEFE
ncbi:hypothetical protein GCM10012284_18330 [Mangrovihabitans endophyticus]|uniref:SWIM-type domain-containing protein n=1 Tax=Mangrovihabitans endophyticus TaxID=1751298 RepID=A0A8J3BYR5_9ACTN|nr:hypothetical protein GCM10012284_18330 [Mangrovihabitans endophyticus]